MDETQFPRGQNTHKQQNRKPDPKRQCARHVPGLGLAVAAALEHEIQRGAQTAKDGQERDNDEVHHAPDYPVSFAHLPARFWLLTLATLVGVALTLGLGFWQLSRASEKLALQAAIDSRQTLAVLGADALLQGGASTGLLHRRVSLRGTWLARHTVYLENRQMNGRPGFFVLTPLQLESAGMAVVVQRGWVQRSFTERTLVPKLATPAGSVQIEGRIAPPPSKFYEFEQSQGGVIRQNLDMALYSREIGAPLAAVSVLQTGAADDGLLREWPRITTGVEKHYGYAFQWFALGGLIASLYGWFQIVRRFIPGR